MFCNNNKTFAQLLAGIYVGEYLGQETVDRLTGMAQGLIDTYKTLLDDTSWLGEESQQNVLDKLDNMRLNILAPDGGYFDFDDVELTKPEGGGTLLGNYLKLKEHMNDHENELLDQKARCYMPWLIVSPNTVNAFYSEFDNSINILPGIVTSNIYRKDMTDSEMLGSIGYIVGHEISHAFDFRGSQMDHNGCPGSIFTEEDVDAFLKICDDIIARYDAIEYMPGRFVDGKRIIAEAGADLSGMQVAVTYAQTLPEYDLTQLFEKASQIFVQTGSPQVSATYAILDSHPLRYLRVNVNAQMQDAFYDTYGVEEGDGMYLAPEDRILYWGK